MCLGLLENDLSLSSGPRTATSAKDIDPEDNRYILHRPSGTASPSGTSPWYISSSDIYPRAVSPPGTSSLQDKSPRHIVSDVDYPQSISTGQEKNKKMSLGRMVTFTRHHSRGPSRDWEDRSLPQADDGALTVLGNILGRAGTSSRGAASLRCAYIS